MCSVVDWLEYGRTTRDIGSDRRTAEAINPLTAAYFDFVAVRYLKNDKPPSGILSLEKIAKNFAGMVRLAFIKRYLPLATR